MLYSNHLFFLLLLPQGRPGPKGDRGDQGITGLQVRTFYSFLVYDHETKCYPQVAALILECKFSPTISLKPQRYYWALSCQPSGRPLFLNHPLE